MRGLEKVSQTNALPQNLASNSDWRIVHLVVLSRNDKHTNRFSTSVGMKVTCWNVRTLLDKELSKRPPHRTALLARELSLYDIYIAGFSETRLADVGQLTETGSGYTFFWKGKPADEAREHGVGFAIKSPLSKKLQELPFGKTEHISLRLPL